MPGPKLMAVITAMMMIAAATGGRAEYSLAQLQELERLILAKNCGSLWSYLQQNPAMMSGDDPLAKELQIFVRSTERGLLNCFSATVVAVGPLPVVPQVPATAQNFLAGFGAAY